MRRLNFNHLYYFWMVARLGSVTAASREIHITQPTISTQIKQLEKALGAPLFSRAGGRLILTSTGQTVMRHADEMFGLGQNLLNSLSGEASSQPRRFVVGISEAIPKLIATAVLESLAAANQSASFTCLEWRGEQLLAEFSLRRMDIAITEAPIPPSSQASFVECLLGESAISLCAAPAMVKSLRPGFPGSLDRAPIVMPAPGTVLRQKLQAWLDANNLRPTVVAEVEDRALGNYLGQAGFGVIPVATVIEDEIRRQFDVRRIGLVKGVQDRYYATALGTKLTQPMIAQVFAASRERLVSSRLVPRESEASQNGEPVSPRGPSKGPKRARPRAVLPAP